MLPYAVGLLRWLEQNKRIFVGESFDNSIWKKVFELVVHWSAYRPRVDAVTDMDIVAWLENLLAF